MVMTLLRSYETKVYESGGYVVIEQPDSMDTEGGSQVLLTASQLEQIYRELQRLYETRAEWEKTGES